MTKVFVEQPWLHSHIVPCGKFHRIGGAPPPPETFPNVQYDAPEEVATVNVLTALLGNEVCSQFFM